MDLQELKNKVAKDRIGEVLNSLLELLEGKDKKLYNEAATLAANYHQWKQNNRLGMEPTQSTIQQIRFGLLSLIDEASLLLAKLNTLDPPAASQSTTGGVLQKIATTFGIGEPDLCLLIYHLGNTSYDWRKLSTLEKHTGLSAFRLDNLARSYPEGIRRSENQKGEAIFQLKAATKAIFKKEITS